MLRHRVDSSVMFSREKYEHLPDQQMIEVAGRDPVPTDNPDKEPTDREPYLPSDELVDAVNLAIGLGRPLLLQGDPGCGKTRLAYALAYFLGMPLEECYIKSTSRAQDMLYAYDAVSRLYDSQLGKLCPKGARGKPRCEDPQNYVRLGPLGRSIARAQYARRSVVLIDEIDKADLDFPNDLLYELDRLEFAVPEAPELRFRVGDNPELRPIIVVTHNEEKALPTAFLRRCIFHYLEFPRSAAELEQILELHAVTEGSLREKTVEIIQRLRKLTDLRKKPGLSELIDWAVYVQNKRTPIDKLDEIPYIGAILKQREDQLRVSGADVVGA